LTSLFRALSMVSLTMFKGTRKWCFNVLFHSFHYCGKIVHSPCHANFLSKMIDRDTFSLYHTCMCYYTKQIVAINSCLKSLNLWKKSYNICLSILLTDTKKRTKKKNHSLCFHTRRGPKGWAGWGLTDITFLMVIPTWCNQNHTPPIYQPNLLNIWQYWFSIKDIYFFLYSVNNSDIAFLLRLKKNSPSILGHEASEFY
jgi:hypothetical protein